MRKLYVLIMVAVGWQPLFAQTIKELNLLINETDPSKYPKYLQAAREDGDSARVLAIKNLLGKTLIANHRYNEAEKLLLENVTQLQKGYFGTYSFGNLLSLYDCYDYLGKLYIETSNYRKANFYLTQAYLRKSKSLTKNSVSRIDNTRNLCEYHLSKEQFDSAYRYLKILRNEMVRTKQSSGYLNELFLSYYKGMTEISLSRNNLKDANHYFKKALSVYTPMQLSRKNLHDPELHLLKSRILLRGGKLKESLRYSKSLPGKRIDSLRQYPESLRLQIVAYYRLKDFNAAFKLGRQLMQIDLTNVRKVFPDLTEDEKSEFNKNIHLDFSLLVSVLGSLNDDAVKEQYGTDLLAFRIQTKGLLLEHTQQLHNYYKTANSQAYEQMESIKLRRAEAMMRDEVQRVAALSDSIELLERTLSAEMRQAGNSDPANLEKIMAALKTDEIAIEIIQFQQFAQEQKENEKVNRFGLSSSSSYLLFFIERFRISANFINDGEFLDNRASKYYKHSVVDVGIKNDSLLSNYFWKPLSQKIGNKRKIFLSADGVFSKVNMNVLSEDGQYLIDKYNFTYLPNIKDILKSPAPLLPSNSNATLIGWANFNSEVAHVRGGVGLSLRNLHQTQFSDLPGTGDEIKAIRSILGQAGWNTRSLVRENATENMVKTVDNPTILHIATHGFFIEESTDSDPMLQTGLVFTGVDIPDAPINNDGILTAYETTSLRLDKTNVVILSACETGLGVISSGEGVYGLQRAFQIAGAKNIIMSFWKVDDRATQALMTNFYKKMVEGKSLQEAFMTAQIELRKQFPAPRDWGAFILLGK